MIKQPFRYYTCEGALYRFAPEKCESWIRLGMEDPGRARREMGEYGVFLGHVLADVVDFDTDDFMLPVE